MKIRNRTRSAAAALGAAVIIPLGLLAIAPAANATETPEATPSETGEPSDTATPTPAPPSEVADAPAPAADAAATYKGKVNTTALTVRKAPTSASPRVTTLPNGTVVTIQCKVFGPAVGGNDLWYKLSTGRWVTARYVSNIGAAPRYCGSGREYVGRVVSNTSLAVRSGPNLANAKVSSAPKGTELALVCKVDSQVVGGNARWYQLTGDGGGQWVSARYVANVGTAPPYC